MKVSLRPHPGTYANIISEQAQTHLHDIFVISSYFCPVRAPEHLIKALCKKNALCGKDTVCRGRVSYHVYRSSERIPPLVVAHGSRRTEF